MRYKRIPSSNASSARPQLGMDLGCQELGFDIPPSFTGAVLIVDAAMNVRTLNEKSQPLYAFFMENPQTLKDILYSSVAENQIDQQKLQIPGPDGTKTFQLFMMPVASFAHDKGNTLLVALDTSLEQNLISALMESRQLFKDLVTCSSDFAWETNAEGEFQYVSPEGALDYSASELVGHRARKFLCASGTPSIAFETREPVHSQELWFYSYSGSKSCLSISAIPKISRDGVWQGARGICHDITIIKKQEAALEQARKFERLRIDIISAIRDLKAGDQLLSQTALAITKAIPDIICRIARQKNGQCIFTPPVGEKVESLTNDILADCSWLFFADNAASHNPGAHTPQTMTIEGGPALYMMTEYRHKINGVIFLMAPPDGNLPVDASEMLIEASSHVGIAINHIETHEHLERLSRTDELTGLLNRRAFLADAELCLLRLKSQNNQVPHKKGCALLYLDIDNLKAVNDQTGHASGDFVIASFGQKLAALARGEHTAARIGGDEFLLLMNNVSREEAKNMARQLVDYCKSLNESVGNVTPALGLSVGISLIGAHKKMEIGEIITQADEALYKAKKSGKGTFIVIEN